MVVKNYAKPADIKSFLDQSNFAGFLYVAPDIFPEIVAHLVTHCVCITMVIVDASSNPQSLCTLHLQKYSDSRCLLKSTVFVYEMLIIFRMKSTVKMQSTLR